MSGIKQSKITKGTVLAGLGGKGLKEERWANRSSSPLMSKGVWQKRITKGLVLANLGGKILKYIAFLKEERLGIHSRGIGSGSLI